MSKLEQHQLWETYSVDLLKAIRRELAYADRFEAIKIVNEIIEKKISNFIREKEEIQK